MRKPNSIAFKIIGKYAYEVYPDEFPRVGIDFDFGNKEDNEAFIKKFEDGELESYLVAQLKQCGKCDEWHEVDNLGFIYASTPEEAISVFIDGKGEDQ